MNRPNLFMLWLIPLMIVVIGGCTNFEGPQAGEPAVYETKNHPLYPHSIGTYRSALCQFINSSLGYFYQYEYIVGDTVVYKGSRAM